MGRSLAREISGSAIDSPYDPSFFEALYKTEDRHFWFVARNRVIAAVVKQLIGDFQPGYSVLEVGCGTGNVLRVLERACSRGTVVGMDLFAEGLRYARLRSRCGLVQGDVQTPPFTCQFDLIGCFDVLEHLPNDVPILRDLHALLAPNGALLITVPARMSLWSYFDEASHHQRRYDLAELSSKLSAAGFRVEYLTSFMATLFPFVWLGRRVAGLGRTGRPRDASLVQRLSKSELRVVPVANEILSSVLAVETRAIDGRRRLPFGTSLLSVARKR